MEKQVVFPYNVYRNDRIVPFFGEILQDYTGKNFYNEITKTSKNEKLRKHLWNECDSTM